MEDPKILLSGYAPSSELLYCAMAKADTPEVIEPGMFPFSFQVLVGTTWWPYATEFNWAPIAVASVKPEGGSRFVVALGAHGEIYEIQTTGAVEKTGALPGKPGFLGRNLAVVGDTIYAVGMGRAIARRDGPMKWKRIDPKLPVDDDEAVGFNDLVAVTPDEMYTVGWDGVILRTDGRQWQKIDSPVSAPLRAACVGADGLVYAVGYNGTMVRGRGDAWEVIETGRKGVLLDVCAFKDKILVANSFDVMELGPTGLVPVSNFEDPDDRPSSCVALCAAADGSGVFWLGGPDVFRITDQTWHRVP